MLHKIHIDIYHGSERSCKKYKNNTLWPYFLLVLFRLEACVRPGCNCPIFSIDRVDKGTVQVDNSSSWLSGIHRSGNLQQK